jgi:hypothetical protein
MEAGGAAAAASDRSMPDAGSPRPSPVVAKPVGGIGLGLSAISSVIVRFFRKLFGRKE